MAEALATHERTVTSDDVSHVASALHRQIYSRGAELAGDIADLQHQIDALKDRVETLYFWYCFMGIGAFVYMVFDLTRHFFHWLS